jgi:hypothetical protein
VLSTDQVGRTIHMPKLTQRINLLAMQPPQMNDSWMRISQCWFMLCVAFLIGCGESPAPKETSTSTRSDSTKIREQAEDDLEPRDTARNRSAPSAAQLILTSHWKSPIDEQLVQSVLDSLRSPQRSTRGIQAKAISRVWPRCDGGLAEVVGLSAFNYVEREPVEFFSLFPAEIPWQELGFWSDMIAQELIIEHESDPKGAAKQFMAGLNERAMQQGVDIHIEVDRMQRQVLSSISELTVSIESR